VNLSQRVELLQPGRAGLSSSEAASRLKSYGENSLPLTEQRSAVRIFINVLRQPMFLLLIGGGLIYLLLGDRFEALMLMLFACFSIAITLVQEARSERVLQALRDLSSPRARVLRDGKRVVIAGSAVVPGDVLIVSEGERISADAVLFDANELIVDESLLTGESIPVRKLPAAANTDAARDTTEPAGGDDSPRIFAGTLVVRGHGQALVHSTGKSSAIGGIGRALAGISTGQPHLQRQIAWLVRDFAIVGTLAGVSVVLLFGLLRGSWLDAALSGIALGMSLLPEEFPLVLAVFMAMGAWRISKVGVLTRRAAAIETLGATTVLCTDKTGTLTENHMHVVSLLANQMHWTQTENIAPDGAFPESLLAVLRSALYASAAQPIDPMDIAVHELAKLHLKLDDAAFAHHLNLKTYGLRPDCLAVANVLQLDLGQQIDLDSAAATKHVGTTNIFAKGAFEAIAQLCQMPAADIERERAEHDAMARLGIRVLALAQAQNVLPQHIVGANAGGAETPVVFPEQLNDAGAVFNFHYVGLVGFADPLRANVPAAVAQCQSAGIRVVMITGDYPATAWAIAQQAGIVSQRINANQAEHILTGAQLEQLNDSQLAQRVQSTAVFARIRPEQKLRIVQSIKASGAVVAMTGDGVNDAPAIKAADIGIAMGGRGSDVAREASALVLLNDDFAAIVKTIRLGRRVYDNLRKAIEFIVSVHIPIAGLALLPLLLNLPLLLTPILIAFLEMVIDPACSIVFEAEHAEADVMKRPPRDPATPLLQAKRVSWAVLQGVVSLGLLVALLIYEVHLQTPAPQLRALMFSALVLTNIILILVNRSFDASIVRAFTRPNPSLWILLGAVGVLLMVSLSSPIARTLFHFGALNSAQLILCLSLGIVSLVILEALKRLWFGSGGELGTRGTCGHR
jgi:P-type Ca2+ transporter type 2C